MSSQPDRADSAPSSVSDSSSTNDPQESSSAAEGPRKGPSIRIGTQRYGVKPPPATPKPILPSPPPAARQSDPEPATEQPAAVSADAPLEAPSQATTVEAAAPAQAAPDRAAGRPPGDRKRGDQKPRTPKFIPEPERRSNTPLPNTREQLSADLELEYMEALGGQPLEEIIADQPTEVAPELEPESRHKAKVVSVHRDNVFVELGGHQQGIVQLKNFPEPPEVGRGFGFDRRPLQCRRRTV